MRRSVLAGVIATALLVPVLATLVVYSLVRGTSSGSLASGPPPGPYRGSEPPAQIHMPKFTLRDHRGRVVASSDLVGKVTLLTFLDTDCKTKCPIIASEIGDGLRLLSSAERREVVPLAVSVDPARDTPQRVRTFLRRRRAEQLGFLLGSVRTLRPVWTSFHVLSAAETGNADIHSADVRIFDRRGVWVATQHAGIDLTPSNLAHDIRIALEGDRASRRTGS